MELVSHRAFLFAAALALLVEAPALGQARPDSDYQDPVAEAAAAALAARNLEADAALGRAGGIATAPAAPFVAPEKSMALSATDWPFAPTIKPILDVPIQAIFLANDDGSNPAPISADEVDAWRVRANLIWSAACFNFTFDKSVGSPDYIWVNSTLLNTIEDTTSPDWLAQKHLATDLAGLYPDKLVMFFRFGPDATPIGSGMTWTDMNFIVMPGFQATSICGVQNIGLMAHQLGHFLGLPHTFAEAFDTYGDAMSYYLAFGGGVGSDVFEGDGRDETYADPFIEAWTYQCDPGTKSVSFVDEDFLLPRDNVMAHYYPSTRVLESQFYTARQTWLLRSGQLPHEAVLGGVISYETETMPGSYSGGWWTGQDMKPFLGKWSDDQQLLWLDAAVGDSLKLKFSAMAGGKYDVYVGFTAAPDYATIEARVNRQPGPTVELYSGIVTPTGPVFLGTYILPRGDSFLDLKVVGSDPRALFPRNGVGVDYIALAQPCALSEEVVRLGIPPNKNAFKPGLFGGPIVGTTWMPWVDHTEFMPNSLVDVMVVSTHHANLWFGIECTLLVDLNAFIMIYEKAPSEHFDLPIPMDQAYVGAKFHTQVGSLNIDGLIKLTNALDIKVGSF